ncbi:MAG: hypothetical protein BWX77_00993 [Bacteroidetes bacterium ADurb.Bin090]|jgi:hypothetical protein|nr:MAG: hypothetical protein BWX77_00993 [Bacteroidetes bacterium ADurb.Bin090]
MLRNATTTSSIRNFSLPLSLLLLSLFLQACVGNPNCYESKEVLVYCGFYSSETGKAGSIEKVSVRGLGSDSLIYNDKTLSKLALPLRSDAQESVFIIEIEQSSIVFRDSLSLSHTNNEWFISMECGCIVLHTLLDARPGGASFIDSVCIVNPEIKNAVTEHVKIYL